MYSTCLYTCETKLSMCKKDNYSKHSDPRYNWSVFNYIYFGRQRLRPFDPVSEVCTSVYITKSF